MIPTEKQIQSRLLDWVMNEKNHQIAIPNNTTVYGWECDVLSVTKSKLVHEFEIKRTKSDYKADFKNKKRKHCMLIEKEPYPKIFRNDINNKYVQIEIPSYFWFVTVPTDLDIPKYAGWMVLEKGKLKIKKNAPRLHRVRLKEIQERGIARGLAFRVVNLYKQFYGESR